MVKMKNKTGLMCIITSIVIAMSLLLCWNNSSNAADNRKMYWKYTYKTDYFTTANYTYYYLDALPVINNVPETRGYLNYDERENAPLEQQMVYINHAKSGNFIGTGFIIGDHEIMTAAHCVTTTDANEDGMYMEAWNINVYIPTANPSNGKDISLTPEFMTVPNDYFDSVEGNDYAIIKVKEDLSAYGEVFLGLGTDESIKNTTLYSLGYAKDANNRMVLKTASGKVNSATERMYNCSIDIYGGTSGGPVYSQCIFGVPGSTDPVKKVQTYKTVVGISVVVFYDPNTQYIYSSSATRITPEILQFAYDNKYL